MKLRTLTLIFAAALMIAATPALALDLAEARAAGVVGEKLDGYVGVVKDSDEAEALAADVNARRKKEYTRISGENNQPVDVVGKVAAEQIIGKLDSGSLYQNAKGNWVTK